MDSLKSERQMVSAMRRWRVKTRGAFAEACDKYPSSREVELLRAVADEVLAAGQSTQRALAENMEQELDRLEAAALRWLRHGGRWEHVPGPSPVWREPALAWLGESWPIQDASGRLEPKYRPAFVDFVRTMRTVGEDAPRMRASIVGGALSIPVVDGAYFAARDRVYQSHMQVAQASNVWLGGCLAQALGEVVATAQRWWAHGEWEPPPRRRLIWGSFWEDGGS